MCYALVILDTTCSDGHTCLPLESGFLFRRHCKKHAEACKNGSRSWNSTCGQVTDPPYIVISAEAINQPSISELQCQTCVKTSRDENLNKIRANRTMAVQNLEKTQKEIEKLHEYLLGKQSLVFAWHDVAKIRNQQLIDEIQASIRRLDGKETVQAVCVKVANEEYEKRVQVIRNEMDDQCRSIAVLRAYHIDGGEDKRPVWFGEASEREKKFHPDYPEHFPDDAADRVRVIRAGFKVRPYPMTRISVLYSPSMPNILSNFGSRGT